MFFFGADSFAICEPEPTKAASEVRTPAIWFFKYGLLRRRSLADFRNRTRALGVVREANKQGEHKQDGHGVQGPSRDIVWKSSIVGGASGFHDDRGRGAELGLAKLSS